MSDVKLVSDAHALQSMRASDFDACSAYGEVVDNALEAEARHVKILFKYRSGPGGAAPLDFVAFGDDGYGMSPATLQRCLQLGFSSRFNSRKGIGRFGVGATLGAINQCKRIEVYSKERDGGWRFTYVDLDDVASGSQGGIPTPKPVEIPKEFRELVGESNGTLVIWRKHDKQDAPATRLIEEFTVWAGRTYRRFIWDGASISINGTPVPAIDPLYVRTERTRFPADPPAAEYEAFTLAWPVPKVLDGLDDSAPERSNITVRMSLLPEVFRPTQGSGNSNEATARLIHMNEGVSIMRNDREVFYGAVPWWPGDSFREIDRWWGCEISFDAVLDYSFSVKNIKRGAVPLAELKKTLQKKIDPTRKTALEVVREVWAKSKDDDERQGRRRRHAEAETAAKKGDAKLPRGTVDPPEDLEDELDRFSQDFLNAKTEEQKAGWRELFKSQPFTIEDGRWKGADFLEIKHLGGSDVLIYNATHRFHQVLEGIETELSGSAASSPSRRLRSLIDLMLISFAKAETMFPEDQELLEQLRMYWGNFLQQYIGAWREDSE